MARDSRSDEPNHRADVGFPLGQLQRALAAATSHTDAELRRRAETRALTWEQIVTGIASGTLQVGSRTPVEDTPAWVTLEVAHGGFATGRYLAEGPIEDWERDRLQALPTDLAPNGSPRQRINTWFLTDDGLSELQRRLDDGTFRIDLPEEGALLVVAWLMDRRFEGLALDLVAELYPLIDRLRFYPRPSAHPALSTSTVHLRTVDEVARQLAATTVPDQVTAMRDAVAVWNPLLDRLVGLWQTTIVDGWPCQVWPDSWAAQRDAWLADYEAAVREHPRSRHLHPRAPFAWMAEALQRCATDSSELSGRDVGRLRKAINDTIERWGDPDSPELSDLRARQAMQGAAPTHRAIAAEVTQRMGAIPAGSGITNLDEILAPVTVGDTTVEVPPNLVRKTARALDAPIETLVEQQVIGAAEVLAQVLPQVSSQVAAAGMESRSLQRLYAAIYRAFRRRRSLLLLNLEHQVQIEELPWIDVLGRFRSQGQTAQRTATQTLEQMALLTITSFPHTIIPNPMVKELGALAKHGGLDLPLVEEVAADIFMGTFTTKWRDAARITAGFLDGSLYARYYDLHGSSKWTAPPTPDSGLLDRARLRWGKQTAEDFAEVCKERAREAASGDGSRVARNGTVLEQSQILTSHNLAPLVAGLDLRGELAPLAPDLALRTFDWIVRQQITPRPDWRSNLQMVKNTAYAWRQALFLLSLADEADQQSAIVSMRERWKAAPSGWSVRFEPVLAGLEAIASGDRFDDIGRVDNGRRFLGWSVGPHWLVPTGAES